ncbi:hypothetical protein RU639_013566 [Aspergillus parasiticus]
MFISLPYIYLRRRTSSCRLILLFIIIKICGGQSASIRVMASNQSSQSRSPLLFRIRSSEGFIIAAISAIMFTNAFVYTMITPVLPKALVDHAGVKDKDAQHWMPVLQGAYGGALFLGSPFFAYFADSHRSQKLCLAGSLFALGLSIGYFMAASSPTILLFARATQGLSAAVVAVIGLSVIVSTVHIDHVGRAMGLVVTLTTIGALTGPMFGGIVYELPGYYGYFLPLGLVILSTILQCFMVENKNSESVLHADIQSGQHNAYNTFAEGVPQFRSSDSRGYIQHAPLRDRSSISSRGSSAKEAREWWTRTVHLLDSPRLQAALFANATIVSVYAAFETVLPLFAMETFHWMPTDVGLAFFIMTLPNLCGSLIGKSVDKFGTCFPTTISLSLTALSLIALCFIRSDSTLEQYLLVGVLVIFGVAYNTILITTRTEISKVITETELSGVLDSGRTGALTQGYALLTMGSAAGALMGPLFGGFLKVNIGWEGLTVVLGLLCAVAAVTVGLFSGNS